MKKCFLTVAVCAFFFGGCVKTKILVKPPGFSKAGIYVNGKLLGYGSVEKSAGSGVPRKWFIEAKQGACLIKKKVSSRFDGGLCAWNIVLPLLGGISVGTSLSYFWGDIGAGVFYGTIVGLVLGGVFCPVFSWTMPKTVEIDMETCTDSPRVPELPPPPPEPVEVPSQAGGCQKDLDCKGDRICAKGRCVFPPKRR